MTWGLNIAIYLFLSGIGAGLLFWTVARCTLAAGNLETDTTSPWLYAVSFVIIGVGALILVADSKAGLQNPRAFFGLFTNFGSPMAWGTLFIVLVLVFDAVGFVLSRKGDALSGSKKRAFSLVGAVLAIALTSYTGVLLGAVSPVGLWNNGALPVLFLVSALLSGAALGDLVGALTRDALSLGKTRLSAAFATGGIIEALVVFFLLVVASSNPSGADAVARLISGDLAVPFWALYIVIGLVLPVVLHLAAGKRKVAIYLANATIIVGALALRILIVAAAVPAFVSAI